MYSIANKVYSAFCRYMGTICKEHLIDYLFVYPQNCWKTDEMENYMDSILGGLLALEYHEHIWTKWSLIKNTTAQGESLEKPLIFFVSCGHSS